MSHSWDTVIIGGGASGLAAALFCARLSGNGSRVLLLEKSPRVGRKLLATGNGTCNISNLNAAPCHYHGNGAVTFVEPALQAFTPEDTLAFFDSIGVHCVPREDGKIYPLCQQAGAVLDCLRLALRAEGVTERCDCTVTAIQNDGNKTIVIAEGERIVTNQVIVAAGGAASPSLGGTSDGYALLTSLGHHKTALFPSIVQVKTDTTYIRSMKGLRCDAVVSFECDGKRMACHHGELLFTEYGISGPAVMQISRVVGDWERRKAGKMVAVLDLLPSYTFPQLQKVLERRQQLAGKTGEDFLTGLLNKRIGQTVCRAAGFSLNEDMSRLTQSQRDILCETIKNFCVNVLGTQGFGAAQVTAGGIALEEVQPHTMQSRRYPQVYLVGEVLDVDGDCGGYNLQWAWASAYAAAKAIYTGEAI